MKRSFLFALLFFFCALIYAQTEREITPLEARVFFKEMAEQYQSAWSFQTHYKSFAGESSNSALEEFKGIGEMSPTASYYEFSGTKVYSNESWVIQIIEEENRIYILKNKSQQANWLEKQFDEYLNYTSKIIEKSKSNGFKQIVLFFNEPFKIERAEYGVDTYGRMSSVTMISRYSSPLIDGDFSEANFQKSKITIDYFDYKKIDVLSHQVSDVVTKINEGWIGNGVYKNFEITELANF